MQPDRKHKEKQNDDIIASNRAQTQLFRVCVRAHCVAFHLAPHPHANPSHIT